MAAGARARAAAGGTRGGTAAARADALVLAAVLAAGVLAAALAALAVLAVLVLAGAGLDAATRTDLVLALDDDLLAGLQALLDHGAVTREEPDGDGAQVRDLVRTDDVHERPLRAALHGDGGDRRGRPCASRGACAP